jgi:hypothetical protein
MKKVAFRIILIIAITFIAYEGHQFYTWQNHYSDWKELKSDKEETLTKKLEHEKMGRIPNYLARQGADWDNIHLLETERRMKETESGMILTENKSVFLSLFCPPTRKVTRG